MSFEVVRYTPEWRASLVSLLARVGTTHLSDEEFAWWFDRNPAGEGIVSLAVDGGEVVGVAAMSFFRTRLEGVERLLAIPVNVATDARYRGQGVFSTLEHENETAASDSGSPLTVTFPNAKSYPIFVQRLGWLDLPRLRLWARPLRLSGVVRYALDRTGERETMRPATSDAREIRGLDVRPVERFGADMDGLGNQAAARVRKPLRARRRVLQLALPRLAARLPLLRRLSRRRACRRRRGRSHVQARHLGRLPRRSRRRSRGRRGRSSARGPRTGRGAGRGRCRRRAAPARHRAPACASAGGIRAVADGAALHRQDPPRRRAHRRASRSLALHPRRLRLFLMRKRGDPLARALRARRPLKAAASHPHRRSLPVYVPC